ncbi:MAG: 4-(cytidine 5'-diphospho)-2-C-methyl-D-erythritol kinase [Treponema sp.]|nr:4-(cytidine 5'-diphospho)-2-C-methyl-D-erythritol kinase [Treponema sp.]
MAYYFVFLRILLDISAPFRYTVFESGHRQYYGEENMTGCTIEAPGKINLHLQVKERRSDGYHELESIFVALAFGDRLRFELTSKDEGCELHGGGDIPPGQNLIERAVALFRVRTGFSRGLRVWVEKRIPLGAGLGGGSSDAASTLRALNMLAATDLAPEALGEMARSLGSDVPFFLSGGAALVSGRGERILPLRVPEGLSVVVVYPGFPSNTAGAFRLLDKQRDGQEIRDDGDTALLIRSLGEHPRGWPYRNDFLPVFLSAGNRETAEAYRGILQELATLGADFAGLSGAGSSCFGIFVDSGVAEKAARTLRRPGNFVQVTFFLACLGALVLK